MLRIWYTQLPEDFRCDEDRVPLSVYRKEKLQKLRSVQARRQALATEILLNQAVRELCPDARLPLDIRAGESGKPFFVSLPFCFSLSHSGRFVACAIADHEIGLDIQQHSTLHESLVRRFFSEAEQRFIRESLDRDAAFTAIWCLKESYLKATGEGLSGPLSDFSLDLRGPLTLRGSDSVRFWHFRDESFQLAVCSLDGGDPTPERVVKNELRQ